MIGIREKNEIQQLFRCLPLYIKVLGSMYEGKIP